jgi:hypothetical protein
MSWSAPRTVVALAALGVAVTAGCAGPGVLEADAEAAVKAGDGQAACDLLLPDAAESLEQDAEAPCATAVVEDPRAGQELAHRAADAGVTEVHVAGMQAQVVTASDTVFLARSGERWIITAAACERRPERPYDCEVEA